MQSFFVGSVCASRTEVYHALKHFKYHLFERCRTALEAQKEIKAEDTVDDDEPVKDTVNKVFTKLQDGGWISEVWICNLLLCVFKSYLNMYEQTDSCFLSIHLAIREVSGTSQFCWFLPGRKAGLKVMNFP